MPDVEPQRQHQAQRSTVRSQAFIARHLEVPVVVACELYGQPHLYKTLDAGQIVLRLIEDAMAQPGAHEDSYEAVEKQRVEFLVLDFLVFIQPSHHKIGQRQSYQPAQRVPAERQRSQVKCRQVRVPSDK